MEEKTVHIPFEYDSFITGLNNFWQYTERALVRRYITFTVLPILVLLTAFVFKLKDIYPLVLLLSSAQLIYIAVKWANLYRKKKVFFSHGLKYAQEYQSKNGYCTYTFNEQGIKYQDMKNMYNLDWQRFSYYIIIKNTIFLVLKSPNYTTFSINKQAIGKEDLEDVYAILNEKIGFKEAL